MQRKSLKFIQGVDFDLIANLPNNGTKYLLIFDDSCEEISCEEICKNCHCWEPQGTEYKIRQTQFISSKQIMKRCRVKQYTHSLVQVAEGCFTNQYIKSTTRSRITIERVVSRCNIYSLWIFTH